MKILVMSLLRIGDIVLAAPVLRGLREKHPQAEIHLLINSQFKAITPLIPYIDKTIPFDREGLQKGLGSATAPMFGSYDRLDGFLENLDTENYDWVINLTHSRLSGWLMSLLSAKQKTGLCLDGEGRASFGSSWFRYLNSQVDVDGSEVFHFTDVFRFALGLDDDDMSRPALCETDSGHREADGFLAGSASGGMIVVQALTSDPKKDWSLAKMADAITQTARVHPASEFAILGAPFEKDRLVPLVDRLVERGVRARLAILSFEGAFSLLKRSKLLITLDTSIKHLACAARTPVVEISIGSSDYHRTGAYLQGSIILQSKEACAPCTHSKACHRESHACSERLPSDVVAMVASEVLAGRAFQLKTIAEEYRDEVEILRVESRVSGYWAAYSVLEPFAEASVARWVDLACRKVWLETQGSDPKALGTGTEILRLARLLRSIHPDVSETDWRHLLSELEQQAMTVEGRLNGFKVGLQYLRGCYEDPRKLRDYVRQLIAFRDRIRHSPLLRSYKAALDPLIEDDISPAFTRYKRMVETVAEIEKRTEISLRILRGLNGEIVEPKGLERA